MPRITQTVTQGGADAFVQAELATSLEGQTANAFSVNHISYEFNEVFLFGAAANMDVELCITRRTKAAMPNLDDTDIIHKWRWGSSVLSAVGSVAQPPMVDRVVPTSQLLIVEDPLFIQLDSTATTLTLDAIIVIDFEIVSIDALSRLQLLTVSL